MMPSLVKGTILALTFLTSSGHAEFSTTVTQPLGRIGTPQGQIHSVFYLRSSGLLESRSLPDGTCKIDEKICDKISCAPMDYTCCNDGTGDSCYPGYKCKPEGCCKPGTDCRGPHGCLDADQKCGNRCIPKDADCCDLDAGKFCGAGTRCNAGGDTYSDNTWPSLLRETEIVRFVLHSCERDMLR
jgi:hypothetical protein